MRQLLKQVSQGSSPTAAGAGCTTSFLVLVWWSQLLIWLCSVHMKRCLSVYGVLSCNRLLWSSQQHESETKRLLINSKHLRYLSGFCISDNTLMKLTVSIFSLAFSRNTLCGPLLCFSVRGGSGSTVWSQHPVVPTYSWHPVKRITTLPRRKATDTLVEKCCL